MVENHTVESDMHALNQYEQLAENYLNLLHALPYPIAVFRAVDGCILAANQHFCSILNLPVETIADMEPTGFCDLPAGMNGGGKASETLRIRLVDEGRIQWVTPGDRQPHVKADVQQISYAGQACWLVTASAGAGQSLSDNGAPRKEERYRTLVENLNDIVYTTDKNAVVTYVSPNITRLSGYTPGEVIGKNFVDFVHPDDQPGRIEQFVKILGGTNQATEYRLFTKTGDIKWVRTSARPIVHHGRVAGVQGILVDISDRKEIEEALRRSEEKYRILVQHAKDAIFVVQEDHIRFMNPSASEILGYTCECIADRSIWDFVHPDDLESIKDRYRLRLRGDNLSDKVSFKILDRHGDVKVVDLNAVLITWEGKPAILNFLRDVTFQKMMEAQLRNSQKMEALGTLAGGIAHNFNNLLMGIHGNVSLSLMDMDPAVLSRKYLKKIIKLVQSGSKLTRQLLDYARDGNFEANSVDLNRLVRDASETLTATKKRIRIHHRLSENIPCIKADQGQIEQILLNLLLNAADAMPTGGDVFIETSCRTGGQVKENVTLSKNKVYVLLKVSDSGTGIPEKNLDRIFEPFFTTKGLGRGTGLGLSTTYGIVKNHDGEISVESEVNKGTRFCIYLPAPAAASKRHAGYAGPKKIAGQGTILLADDEPEGSGSIRRL